MDNNEGINTLLKFLPAEMNCSKPFRFFYRHMCKHRILHIKFTVQVLTCNLSSQRLSLDLFPGETKKELALLLLTDLKLPILFGIHHLECV